MRVYEALARAFRDEGTSTVFTLLGDAIMEFAGAVDALDVLLYQAHHESAALAMADGWARAGGPGAVGGCAVTWGVGLSNATLPIVQAVKAGTPLVVLTGLLENPNLSQYLDQEPLIVATGAGHEAIRTADRALPTIRLAFYRARAERRPVVVEVPHDVFLADLPAAYEYTPLPRPQPAALVADPAQIAQAADAVAAAERPVVIAGRGVIAAATPEQARDRITAFASHIGALLAATLPMRGFFHGEPYDLGLVGGYSRPLAKELIAAADCLIGLGTSLNYYALAGGKLLGGGSLAGGKSARSATVVQVDVRSEARMGVDRRADVYVRGDALSTIDALRAAVPAGPRYRTREVAARIAAQRDRFDPEEFDIAPGRVDPRQVLTALDEALPTDCPIVFGSGHQRDLGSMTISRWRGPQIQATGAIGQGLSLGVGVALGRPAAMPVAVVEGDGGVLMNIQEFNTIVRYRVPVLLFVMNNGALGSEWYKLPALGFPAELASIQDTDFAAIARAFGCRATTITDPAQVAGVVAEFLEAPGPLVADVRVDRAVVSIPYRARIRDLTHARRATA